MTGEEQRILRGQLMEALSSAEHTSGAHWQAYLFSCCERLPDGSLVIPADKVAHWQRQIDTPYSDLSEREKQSDREEVAHILPIIAQHVNAKVIPLVDKVEEVSKHAAHWEEEFHVARELLVKQEQDNRTLQDECEAKVARLQAIGQKHFDDATKARALLHAWNSLRPGEWRQIPVKLKEATRALLAHKEQPDGTASSQSDC